MAGCGYVEQAGCFRCPWSPAPSQQAGMGVGCWGFTVVPVRGRDSGNKPWRNTHFPPALCESRAVPHADCPRNCGNKSVSAQARLAVAPGSCSVSSPSYLPGSQGALELAGQKRACRSTGSACETCGTGHRRTARSAHQRASSHGAALAFNVAALPLVAFLLLGFSSVWCLLGAMQPRGARESRWSCVHEDSTDRKGPCALGGPRSALPLSSPVEGASAGKERSVTALL